VRQNAAGYAIAEVFKGGVFMENKHRAVLLLNETLFHLTYPTLHEKEIRGQRSGKLITSLFHWQKRHKEQKMKTIGLLGGMSWESTIPIIG
jgi:hypothetical protein